MSFETQWLHRTDEEADITVGHPTSSSSTVRPEKSFKKLNPNELANSLRFGSGTSDVDFESSIVSMIKNEMLLLLNNTINECNKSLGVHLPLLEQEHQGIISKPSLAMLFNIMFYKLARELCSRDYLIFNGNTEEERLLSFSSYLSDLHHLSFFGWSLRDLHDRELEDYTRPSEYLRYSPEDLKRILEKIDTVIDLPKFKVLEKTFTNSNSRIYYSSSLILGIDDDKPRISGDEITYFGLPPMGGKTTHTYSKTHECNTLGASMTLGRCSQSHGESEAVCTKTLVHNILDCLSIEQQVLPNLLVVDRGYTNAIRNFRHAFSTLKTGWGTGNVYVLDKHPSEKAKEKPNFFYIDKKTGCMTLYGAKVTLQNNSEIQLAFGSGTGQMTCLMVPHPPSPQCGPFTSATIGTWYGYTLGSSSKLTEVFPNNTKEPSLTGPLIAFESRTKFLTSNQHGDVCWILARFFKWTSRTASELIRKIVVERLEPFVEHYSEILGLLGYTNLSNGAGSTSNPADIPSDPRNPLSWIEFLANKGRKHLWEFLKRYRIKRPNGEPLKGNSSCDDMVRLSSDYFTRNPSSFKPPPPRTMDSILLPTFLNSILLKPLNSDSIDAFRKGFENENNLACELPTLIDQWSEHRFNIVQLFEVGLCADARILSAANMATSPDRIALINDVQTDQFFVCLVEFKTSLTELELDALRFTFQVVSSTDTFSNVVPNKDHRAQLLHHCATLLVTSILYVQGLYVSKAQKTQLNMRSTRKITLIRFAPSIMDSYVALLERISTELDLKELSEGILEYPSTDRSKDQAKRLIDIQLFDQYGEAQGTWHRDLHTMSLHLNLSKLIAEEVAPPPPCRKILPHQFLLWNWFKGHSDISSRHKEANKLRFKTGVPSKVTNRLLLSCSINVWRLHNMFDAWHLLRDVQTMKQIRKIFSKRVQSFDNFLLKSKPAIHATFRIGEDSTSSSSSMTSATPIRRLAPNTRLHEARQRAASTEQQDVKQHNFKVSKTLLACVECQGTLLTTPSNYRTSQTKYRCKECLVPLHHPQHGATSSCWETWHKRVLGDLPDYRPRTFKRARTMRQIVTPVGRESHNDNSSEEDEIVSTSSDDQFVSTEDARCAHQQLGDD